ncbi:MAG: Do family serine endopeptidase [Balneolaceae bacterium]|nr:Do family serine endopeptidase [Balneolaceae bacterium]
MKRSKFIYPLIALAVFLTAAFAVDFDSNKASMASLPDFSGTTEVASADKKPVGTLREFNDAIVDIADQTTPTVVTVRVTQTVEVPENPFSRFFGMPEGGEERQRRGLGSGVIVSEDGYILTNNHVVEGAEEITVDLSNGESYDGEVIGRDPQTDIAVVKIDAENLQAIEIGNSDDVRVGEMVLAIGSPLQDNLAHSVSMGIISAKNRTIGIINQGAGYETFLQTDAAINPGNSGGALVNMDGELVGINTAIASRSGGNDGIGFAVPSNLAKSVMESLIENGKVVRAQLGIYGDDIDRTLARALGLESSQGILINSVVEDAPAERAGLREGDVIKTLNGKPVSSYANFRTSIATSKPGTEITLGIIREGESRDIEVTLGELSQEQTASLQNQNYNQDMEKELGFRVDELTTDLARQLNLEAGQEGVVVTRVQSGSNAAREGLHRGAVIIKVNKQPVQSLSDFKEEINKLADEENAVVLLQIIPQGAPEVKQYIAFEL